MASIIRINQALYIQNQGPYKIIFEKRKFKPLLPKKEKVSSFYLIPERRDTKLLHELEEIQELEE